MRGQKRFNFPSCVSSWRGEKVEGQKIMRGWESERIENYERTEKWEDGKVEEWKTLLFSREEK